MPGSLKNRFAAADRHLEALQNLFRIRNPALKKGVTVLLFLAALHVFYSYVGVYKYIHERPCSIHASAQCQRASVAQNYYHVDMNFFKPRIQRFSYNDGITGVEFPVIYYTAAVLYKCFGFNEIFLRGISLLIISLGFLCFYLLASRLLKNSLLALVITFAAISSPVLLFYSPSFMPDTPGLGLTLCAWYFFFKYSQTQSNRHLLLFVAFGSLGALIKVVSMLSFAVVLCLLVLDRLKFFKTGSRVQLFKHPGRVLLGVISGMLTVVAWYAYAQWLTRTYGNNSFALTPVLVRDMETLKLVYHFVRNTWLLQYYPYEAYMLLISAVVFILLTLRQANRLLLTVTVLYFMGSLCYIYLFLNQFMHHDYYFIALLPCAFFLLLSFADSLQKLSLKYSQLILVLFLVIIFFNLKESFTSCRENYAFRYDSKVYLGGEYRPYYDLAPKLRAMGITRSDQFVSAFDDSYSNSLYFMDQPGFTIENCYERDTIQHSIDVPGVKYLIVSDSAKFNKAYPNHFEKNIVLVHRGLIIYKIK